MNNQSKLQISKSDFLLFMDAPRHLWAKKHGLLIENLSDFAQHLIEEGGTVEGLGVEYLNNIIVSQNPGYSLEIQRTFEDGPFNARVDGLVYRPDNGKYDLYEIKSTTKVDKEIEYDVTFQALILEKNIPVEKYYVLHLNKEYIRQEEIEIANLFIAEDISEQVEDNSEFVLIQRDNAFRISKLSTPDEAEACFSPKDCPCADICHPGLPDFSIFDIPRLQKDKKRQLIREGIIAAKDVPDHFGLNDIQSLVVECAKTGEPHIDKMGIETEINNLEFPLWFLDYETCISAIPLFLGYHPQQQNIFQYSLHCLENEGGELKHFEYVDTTKNDPSIGLLDHLSKDLGKAGTVLVWNKTFEQTMNKEMAKLHPHYSRFLEQLNDRIYDLGDIVFKGYYVHPAFRGSWSIKNVLPVMVPELSYKAIEINKGDQASMAWWNIIVGNLDEIELIQITENLKIYCELDTLAMVEIYRRIKQVY